MTPVPPLETPRLVIRPFFMDDLEAIHHILDVELADAELGKEGAASRRQRAEWLRWTIASYAQLARLHQPPYGDRAIVLKSTGLLIGSCGFVPSFGPFHQLLEFAAAVPESEAGLNVPEVGLFYAVSPSHQRRGYASEAARAMIDYAFRELRLQRIVATTTDANTASIRVMQRAGMQVERNPHPDPPWFQMVGLLFNRSFGAG
jgi:ribosomal-protein-alanine N-acetyltransferase